ncbi:MAG: diguanylate cyclase [Nitrospinae bacterium]|nr:diguanylate cyclase [Nitrospinota bacterium]
MKKRILFVDDDRNLLDAIRRKMRALGNDWEAVYLSDPAEALDAIKRLGPAALVTDWNMPGTDGIRLCRTVRDLNKDGESGYCYVILLTGETETEKIVEALENGADDFVSKPFDTRELVARIRAGARIVELENGLRAANKRLETLAFTDPLTGLFNRRKGMEVLENEMARAQRKKGALSAIMADVDHFKSVNDSRGHRAGDEVLREIARRLRQTVRKYDTLVRWGGEEVLVVCPDTGAREVETVAERFRRAVASRPVEIEGQPALEVTASFGAATASDGDLAGVERLIERADEALYRAKNSGRNCVKLEMGSGDENDSA